MIGFVFLTLVCLGVIAIYIGHMMHQREITEERIHKYIQVHGGHTILIEHEMVGRDILKFQVTYHDKNGREHQTECTFNHNDNDDILFWSVDPVIVLATSIPSSTKEQIISDLTAEVERLQAELNQQQSD